VPVPDFFHFQIVEQLIVNSAQLILALDHLPTKSFVHSKIRRQNRPNQISYIQKKKDFKDFKEIHFLKIK
jgi:hypothetical protein